MLGFGKYFSPDFDEKEYLYEMIKNAKKLMQTVKAKKEGLEPLLNSNRLSTSLWIKIRTRYVTNQLLLI